MIESVKGVLKTKKENKDVFIKSISCLRSLRQNALIARAFSKKYGRVGKMKDSAAKQHRKFCLDISLASC